MDFIVPFSMELISVEIDLGELLVGNFDTLGVGAGIQLEWTFSPVVVRVAAIRLTMTSRLTNGLPRQFWVMSEKSRCSILFHLLVPGGKWHTRFGMRCSSANFCSSTFHKRTRLPLLPPPSAEICRLVALGI